MSAFCFSFIILCSLYLTTKTTVMKIAEAKTVPPVEPSMSIK